MAHVLIVGNPVDGFAIYGPFETADDARSAGEDTSAADWWIATLQPPSSASVEPFMDPQEGSLDAGGMLGDSRTKTLGPPKGWEPDRGWGAGGSE